MDTIKKAFSSNTFDPDTEIPDLSGKVSYTPLFTQDCSC